jgi:serine protease inhibitor ecotin
MSNYNTDLFLEPTVKQYGSHMVMTNVHKTIKTKYINIDTKFRDEYHNNDLVNYNVTLPERINDVKKLSIKSIEIPMTTYNISSTLGNNYFKISNISLDASDMIIIPDGQYTITTLISAINSQIAQKNSYLNYLMFNINNNFSSFFRSTYNGASWGGNDYNITIDFAVDKEGNFDKYNFKSKLGWLLGFRNLTYDVQNNFDGDTRIYTMSEAFIDLNGSKYLYLAIDEFSKSNPGSFVTPLPTSFINKSIIARITLDKSTYCFNSILPSNMYNGLLVSDVRTYSGKIDIQKLNLQLLNDFGNPISLNGIDFSLCLEVEYE